MEWLFQRKNSIADAAQRVVSDMHYELDKQNRKVKDLERTIFKFKNMCTESLERDITRLENRKKELISELESTDNAILDAQERLRLTKEEVASVIQPYNSQKIQLKRVSSLDEQYLEESDMLAYIKTAGSFLFIIHLNTTDDIFVYKPSEDNQSLVSVSKIADLHHPNVTTTLTSYELIMAYGAKIVPNADRDFPDINEIPLPATLISESIEKGKTNGNNGNNFNNNNTKFHHHMGELVGAFEIPLLPGVIVDIWRERGSVSPYRYWATTPVDGIGFAVLERVQLELSEHRAHPHMSQEDEVITPLQADLFGRHPSKGTLLMERVKSDE
jgi:hypothetical protein